MSRFPGAQRLVLFALIMSGLLAIDNTVDEAAFTAPQQMLVRLAAREAGTPPPSIAGDFTKWTPVRMKRHGDEWRYSVQLSPGVYRFAFRGADGDWFVPARFPNRTDDEMGGWVAVLIVP